MQVWFGRMYHGGSPVPRIGAPGRYRFNGAPPSGVRMDYAVRFMELAVNVGPVVETVTDGRRALNTLAERADGVRVRQFDEKPLVRANVRDGGIAPGSRGGWA